MPCCSILDCCHRQKYQSGDKGNKKSENMWLLTQIPSFLKKPPKERTEEVAWKGQYTDYKSVEGDESVCFLRESPFRILRAAENGNVKEFQRILSGDPAKLVVYDGRGRRPVHQAAAKNRKEILKVIVEYGGDLNLKDNAGNTPLHLAMDKEAVDAIEFLLQNNVDCRVLNQKLQSPVHLGADHNRPKSLRALSKYTSIVDVNQGGPQGRTALHLACINDHDECVIILMEELLASPSRSCAHGSLPIHEATKRGSWKALKALVTEAEKRGCSSEEMMNVADAEGNLPLHCAIQGGDRNTVRICLEAGAKISAPQREKSTAVHLACAQGALNIVKLMYELQPRAKETSLNSGDIERLTPLHYAAMFDHTELVEYLASQNACLDLLDKNRRTPLHLAASRNSCQTVKLLIQLGADTMLQDKDGRTVLHTIVQYNGDLSIILQGDTSMSLIPALELTDNKGNTALQIATKQGQISSVSKLIMLGASIITKNQDGDNMFHIACRFGHIKVIQQILQLQSYSFVINESNGSGKTPLHLGALEGYQRIVHILMQKGALLHRDHRGRTPLHLAAMNGNTEVMKTLLSIHGHLINLEDKNGDTALHIAALNNQAKAADLLLTLECDLKYNNEGDSAVDFAILNKFTETAYNMVTHKRRAGEVLEMTKGRYPCIMEALVEHMPGVAMAVLDNSIKKPTTEKPNSPSYYVEYDFKWLSRPEPPEDTDGPKNLPPEQRYLPILNAMVKHGRVALLSHELSLKYLQMKRTAYGQYFNLTSTVFYIGYLIILTIVFTSGVHTGEEFWVRYAEYTHKYSHDDINCKATNRTFNESSQEWSFLAEQGKNRYYGNEEWKKDEKIMVTQMLLLLLISGFNIFVEIINICRHGPKYCQNVDTWIWMTMNVAIFGTTSAFKFDLFEEENVQYLNSGMAVAAFLGWFYLLLLIQRSDTVGLYVSMFLEILKTLLRVLIIFSILIIAFAVAFYILLSNGNHIVFSTFPMSVMRTFSMMLGDLDFMNTFAYPHHCGQMELEDNVLTKSYACVLECQYFRRIPDPATTFPAVAIYMIFMPIVMINFLIGLAVGDIDAVRKNAQMQRLSMQVQSHTNLEKMLPKFFIRRVDKKKVIEYPNFQRRFTRFQAAIAKFFHHSVSIKDDGETVHVESNDLMEAIVDMNTTLQNLSSEIENIRSLLMSQKTGDTGSSQRGKNTVYMGTTREQLQRTPTFRFSRRGQQFNRSLSTETSSIQ